MCAIDSISANFQKYNNYYLSGSPMFTTPVASQPAISQPVMTKPAVYYKEPDTENAIIGAGILQIIAMAVNKLSEKCGQMLMRGKEFATPEQIEKIAESMINNKKYNGLHNSVDYKFVDTNNVKEVAKNFRHISPNLGEALDPVVKGQNAFFIAGNSAGKGLAVAPKTQSSLILHELGHAVHSHKNGIMKLLQNSRRIVPYVPTALLLLNGLTPDKTEGQNFIERNAGKLGFLAFLPTIIEEGMASLKGIKAAKNASKTLGKLNLKPLIKNYGLAWMTYVLAGVGLGIAAKQTFISGKNENK